MGSRQVGARNRALSVRAERGDASPGSLQALRSCRTTQLPARAFSAAAGLRERDGRPELPSALRGRQGRGASSVCRRRGRRARRAVPAPAAGAPCSGSAPNAAGAFPGGGCCARSNSPRPRALMPPEGAGSFPLYFLEQPDASGGRFSPSPDSAPPSHAPCLPATDRPQPQGRAGRLPPAPLGRRGAPRAGRRGLHPPQRRRPHRGAGA